MEKKSSFSLLNILSIILLILPFPLIAYYWNVLPEEVPIHWNAKGEPDGWGSKWWGISLMPLINIVMYFFLGALPMLAAKKNIPQFWNTIEVIRLLMVGFFFCIFGLTLLFCLGSSVNISLGVICLVLVLFMVLGNYMGKFRPNYFVGVRTPWTLENEEVWAKTHRLTGRLWVIGSFLMIGITLLLHDSPYFVGLFISFVLFISFFPIIYSFVLYKRIERNNENQEA